MPPLQMTETEPVLEDRFGCIPGRTLPLTLISCWAAGVVVAAVAAVAVAVAVAVVSCPEYSQVHTAL